MTARTVQLAYLFTTYLIASSCWFAQIVTSVPQPTSSLATVSSPFAQLLRVRPSTRTNKQKLVLFVPIKLFIIHAKVNCSSQPYGGMGVWGKYRFTSSHSEARLWMKFIAFLDAVGASLQQQRLTRRLFGSSGRLGEEKNLLLLRGVEPGITLDF